MKCPACFGVRLSIIEACSVGEDETFSRIIPVRDPDRDIDQRLEYQPRDESRLTAGGKNRRRENGIDLTWR